MPLNSGEMSLSASHGATANETSVGGTLNCSNEPLIESLPPIAATPKPFCALNAPNSAVNGRPHFSGSSPSFSKYSWKVKYARRKSAPIAVNFASDSTTASTAPWNGLHVEMFGLKPHVIAVAVFVLPSTGSFAAMPSAGVN